MDGDGGRLSRQRFSKVNKWRQYFVRVYMYIYLCVYIHIRKFQRSTVIDNHEKKIVKRNKQEEIVRVSQTTRILIKNHLFICHFWKIPVLDMFIEN